MPRALLGHGQISVSAPCSVSAHFSIAGRTSLNEVTLAVIMTCSYMERFAPLLSEIGPFYFFKLFFLKAKMSRGILGLLRRRQSLMRSGDLRSATGRWRGAVKDAGTPSLRGAALAAVIVPLPCKPWWKIIKFHKSLSHFEPLRVSIKCNNGNCSF